MYVSGNSTKKEKDVISAKNSSISLIAIDIHPHTWEDVRKEGLLTHQA